MDRYFTISEFADLRGININSLRYYERLGVLKPAYVDEHTGYRYYGINQLVILNQIILCITIGIPLKELQHYMDDNGELQSKELLKNGQMIAMEKLNEIQNNIQMIAHMLNNIEINETYKDIQGIYKRHIKERTIITSASFSVELSSRETVRQIAKLYKYALKEGLLPVLPAGRIINITENDKFHYKLFLEILNPNRKAENTITLPHGDYNCLRTNLEPSEILKYALSRTDMYQKNIIVDNIKLQKYSNSMNTSEFQVLCSD